MTATKPYTKNIGYGREDENMNIAQFMEEYLSIIHKLCESGVEIDPDKTNIINYEEKIKAVGSPFGNDPVTKACARLYNSLHDNDIFQQDEKILKYLGVIVNPCEILGELRYENELVGYTACFVDDATDRSRYEPVWFPINTPYEEALTQTKKQYRGIYYEPDGLRLEQRREVHRKTYKYHGYLYTIET